ncbi:MAG: 5-formyltetrahydrofolate cyclo-ligase [Pseudomonadota bacterium]
MDTVEQKAQMRKSVFARRRDAHGAAGGKALAARDHFLVARMHVGSKVVSGYRPIRTEIDPTPLMEALSNAGHTLCVPVIQGRGLSLRFAEWVPGAAMTAGPFGAEVPENLRWVEPELLIAPLVAFDRACWRLGYGGGFYDRSLEELRAKRPTRAVGYAYSAQEVDAIPREPTDQPLDGIVTELGLIRTSKDT